jgi:hypothetical protein
MPPKLRKSEFPANEVQRPARLFFVACIVEFYVEKPLFVNHWTMSILS